LSAMESKENRPPEASPLVDYLLRERRAHGPKSREIFKAEDLRDSLVRKSSESISLKGMDDKGRDTTNGKAKLRYEANDVFSISEVRALNGRFSGDALYTPGRDEVWHWDVFPSSQSPKAFTSEERSEVQAMVERAIADYRAREKTQLLIAEIDKAEARVDEEWAKEQELYTAKFGGGGGNS
jgi:hypothetical protein